MVTSRYRWILLFLAVLTSCSVCLLVQVRFRRNFAHGAPQACPTSKIELKGSSPSSLTYRGAVVEFTAIDYEYDPNKTMIDNAKKIVGFIEQAAAKDVDIIVFPELALPALYIEERSLTLPRCTLIPAPSENYTPCNDTSIPVHEAVKMISCAAQHHGIYVVVNLFEKEACSGEDCPSDGVFVYITSVCFDRNGKIISRARKFHQIKTFGVMRVMEKPELSTFDTDFGVTFGSIVCFDIFFEEPTLTLTRNLSVTDIIFSTAFPLNMPFLSTIQFEAGWAYSEDVNLLASGHNQVSQGDSGSGIYAGRHGVLTAILPLDPHEQLLIADIRKKSNIPTASNQTARFYQNITEDEIKDPNSASEYQAHNEPHARWHFHETFTRFIRLDYFETEIITEDGVVFSKLNQTDLECIFQVNLTSLRPPLTYRLLAYNDLYRVGPYVLLGTRICAVVQCADDTIYSCGDIQKSAAIFNSINVTATYIDNGRTHMMPNTLGTNMLPLENWNSSKSKQNEQISETIYSTAPIEKLVTFGFWGRNFETDELSY